MLRYILLCLHLSNNNLNNLYFKNFSNVKCSIFSTMDAKGIFLTLWIIYLQQLRQRHVKQSQRKIQTNAILAFSTSFLFLLLIFLHHSARTYEIDFAVLREKFETITKNFVVQFSYKIYYILLEYTHTHTCIFYRGKTFFIIIPVRALFTHVHMHLKN